MVNYKLVVLGEGGVGKSGKHWFSGREEGGPEGRY